MRDIAIVANFVGNLQGTDNDRFTYLAQMLSKTANVELITSDFCHGQKKKRNICIEQFPFKLTLLHESGYSKNVCLKRFASHMEFGNNVGKYLKIRKKPDVIYCAIPSLTAASAVAEYCKKQQVKFIIDIQDLWPEAFQMVLRIPILSRIIFAPFKYKVDCIYQSADEIVAVSDTYVQRALLVNEKCKTGKCVFIGTGLDDFDANVEMTCALAKRSKRLMLGYCGTLGNSYDLKCVIDALDLIAKRGIVPPEFVVMGDGPKEVEFKEYAFSKKVDVMFLGRLPYEQMCGQLHLCDFTVNPIASGSAASIINKHADYAAAGIPVLNTQESAEYRSLVDKYRMGFNCINGNAEDLANKLLLLMQNEHLRQELGQNARVCAKEIFDRKNTYQQLVQLILDIVS